MVEARHGECGRSSRKATERMQPTALLRRITTGLACLVTLVVLAAGVPIALWRLAGWPLPVGMPSVDQVAQALTRSEVSDATLFKTLALVGWIAWLQVAASLLVESIAWVRSRTAPRLRFVGFAQPAMCKLIASAALLSGGIHVPNTGSVTTGRH